MLPFYQNFPFFCIFLCMVCGVLMTLCRAQAAYRLCCAMLVAVTALNAAVLVCTLRANASFVYWMGHYPAPWGNELRGGPLEALLCTAFAGVMLLCLWGGRGDLAEDMRPDKQNLYFVMLALLLASLLALAYTNDIFTSYVFIEINTISACAIVMARYKGQTISATLRYLIMSLLGSGLFLFGITLLYAITGHLLMEPLHERVAALFAGGQYLQPLAMVCGLMLLGLAIKSALYPAHSWLPDAHGSATTASSAILSGLVLKGYILLLIKILVRVIGLDVALALRLPDVLFVLGALAMTMGSVHAVRENHIKKMIAYSTVAQIGYIYLGIGLGTPAGLAAACLQMLVHMFAKPLLFLCAGALINASGHRKQLYYLRGAAWRCPLAGVGFTLGALSMVGLPLLGGFSVKLALGEAALALGWKLPAALAVLGGSSVLNAWYYVQALLLLWNGGADHTPAPRPTLGFAAAAVGLSAGVIVTGVCFAPLLHIIQTGLLLL